MRNLKKAVVTAMAIAAMSAMTAMSALAATATFYVTKDGGVTYEKAPDHAQDTIGSVTKVAEGTYDLMFVPVNVTMGSISATGQIETFQYAGGEANSLKYVDGEASFKNFKVGKKTVENTDGDYVTGTLVDFSLNVKTSNQSFEHKYNEALLVITD